MHGKLVKPNSISNLAKMCSIEAPLPNFDSLSLTNLINRLDLIRDLFSRSLINIGVGQGFLIFSLSKRAWLSVKLYDHTSYS